MGLRRNSLELRDSIVKFVFSDKWTFYDAKTNTWENRLDNVVKGVAKPFARCKLTKQ